MARHASSFAALTYPSPSATGPPGPPGPPGPYAEEVVSLSFDFSSISPQVLGVVSVGDVFNRAAVLIRTAFDGVGARIRLGTSADLSMFLDSWLTHVGQYESDELILIDVSDVIILTIDLASSSIGSGMLFYKIKAAP